MTSLRVAAVCGVLSTLVLTGCPPPPDTTPTNTAPVAATDVATWTLVDQAAGAPFTSQQTTVDVLANDTDAEDDALTAAGSGTWRLDGDLQPAGTFTVDADGTLTLGSGTDPLGPLQQLRAGEPWPATLQYTVGDGALVATGTVKLTIVGGTDQAVALGGFTGPDGHALDFNDPVPNVLDARGCYGNPEGFHLQHSWLAQSSSNLIPPDPAFVSGADVQWVIALNQDWGFGSSVSVTLTVVPDGPQAAIGRSIDFFVGDGGLEPPPSTGVLDAIPSCAVQSGRPFTPVVDLPELDLRTIVGDSATFDGNVLTGAIEPQGRPMTAGGQGHLGDPDDPYGTYRIHPDGTVTVTMDPDHPLLNGQQYHANAPYRAIGPDGAIGVGELVLRLVGKG